MWQCYSKGFFPLGNIHVMVNRSQRWLLRNEQQSLVLCCLHAALPKWEKTFFILTWQCSHLIPRWFSQPVITPEKQTKLASFVVIGICSRNLIQTVQCCFYKTDRTDGMLSGCSCQQWCVCSHLVDLPGVRHSCGLSLVIMSWGLASFLHSAAAN